MWLEIGQILHQLLQQVQTSQLALLNGWSYLLIALAVVFEGPVATLLSATAASTGLLNPMVVFLAVVAGNLLGDTFWYSLGRLGNADWLLRHGRRLGITQLRLSQFQDQIHLHAPKFIFLTKLTSSLIIPALIAAGLGRISWRRWLPVLIAAEAIKSACLVLIGYFFGEAILQLEGAFKFLPLVTLPLLLLILLPRLRRAGFIADLTEAEVNELAGTTKLPGTKLPGAKLPVTNFSTSDLL
jgi:membrane protein DedA with SNARE-associated domain